MKKEFKVGDKVIIKGIVVKEDFAADNKYYPVKVRPIGSGPVSNVIRFTEEGLYNVIPSERNNEPSLFHAPEFEVGEEIEVCNQLMPMGVILGDRDINKIWNKRLFLFSYGFWYYCISNDDREHFLAGNKAQLSIVQWNYARKVEKPVVSDEDVKKAIRVLEDAGKLKDGKILLG